MDYLYIAHTAYSQNPTKKPLCVVMSEINGITFSIGFRPREKIFSSHSNKASSSSLSSHKLCLAFKHSESFGPYEVDETGKAYG